MRPHESSLRCLNTWKRLDQSDWSKRRSRHMQWNQTKAEKSWAEGSFPRHQPLPSTLSSFFPFPLPSTLFPPPSISHDSIAGVDFQTLLKNSLSHTLTNFVLSHCFYHSQLSSGVDREFSTEFLVFRVRYSVAFKAIGSLSYWALFLFWVISPARASIWACARCIHNNFKAMLFAWSVTSLMNLCCCCQRQRLVKDCVRVNNPCCYGFPCLQTL